MKRYKLGLRLNTTLLHATLAILMMARVADASADYPSGYYNSLEGKCGAELMQAVKGCVSNHTQISYGNQTWEVFKDTDVITVGGDDYWWDMYSNELRLVSDGRPNSNVMNIEHSVANSWWGKTQNAAYKDIVHLNPSDSQANSRKGNYPLAELSNVTWTNGVTSIGKAKTGQGGGASTCYEPADEYKGDFARVFMYMFTVYDNLNWKDNTSWMYNTSSPTMFKPWASELLLRWSADDPVSDKERTRNDGVYQHQHNRNPFIDLPDLAEHIWGSKSTVPFSLDGVSPDPGTDPSGDDTDKLTYKWLSENDDNMGDWTIENISMDGALSYIWSWKQYGGLGYLNSSAYVSGTNYAAEAYAWSPEVSLADISSATFTFDQAAKFQTTLRQFCRVAVKDCATGEVTLLNIPQWPEAGAWTFTNSGNIDLSAFKDKNVRIGFRYKSDTSGADTWEVRNAVLTVKKELSGINTPGIVDDDDSFLVEVWGNNICAPQGARIFDLNGREFDGQNLCPGVYIVVKPTFEKNVKVLIK